MNLKASIILTATVLLMAVLFSCENSPEAIKEVTEASDTLPDERAKNVELIYSDSARIKLIISAPSLERYAGDSNITEFPDGVKLTVYNSKGEIESTLDAKYGRHFPDEKKLEVRNEVKVVNTQGHVLETEHLVWTEGDRMINSNEFVKINTGKEIIYGEGLEAREDFSKYRIKKIKGTITVEDEKQEESEQVQ